MSGGSMNYLYHYIGEAADYVKDPEIKDLIQDLAKLMHDLEWWDSGDYSRADYEESLNDFKKKWFGDNRNYRLEKYINESLDDMKVEIGRLLSNGTE